MSSHTNETRHYNPRHAHIAAAWSRISPWFAWAAAAFAVAVAAVFMLQAGFLDYIMPPAPAPQPEIESPEDTTTYELKLTGYDKENKPYSVAAKKGRQDDKNKDIMYLDGMVAEFSNKSGNTYNIVAATSIYNKKDGSMDMRGDVVVRQGSRFTARMPQALAIIKSKTLSTKEDVLVTFADGTITSEGMEILDDGNRTRFSNGVKARFGYPAQEGGKTP
jgi:LPS export ABC transporter protein LptC